MSKSCQLLPKVSVIVPTYNRTKALEDCLNSLLKQYYPNFDIIVVIDAYTNDYENIINKFSNCFIKIKFLKILSKKPRGPSHCRNIGINNSDSSILAFIDDDAVADQSWLMNLLVNFDDKVAGIRGKIIPKNKDLLKYKFADYDLGKEEKEIEHITQEGNCAFRKITYLESEFFDEKLFGGEGIDLSMRLKKFGFKFKYTPNAIVYHDPLLKSRQLFRKAFRVGKALASLYQKHGLGNVILPLKNTSGRRDSIDLLFNLSILSIILMPFTLIMGLILDFFYFLSFSYLMGLIILLLIYYLKFGGLMRLFLVAHILGKVGNIVGSIELLINRED